MGMTFNVHAGVCIRVPRHPGEDLDDWSYITFGDRFRVFAEEGDLDAYFVPNQSGFGMTFSEHHDFRPLVVDPDGQKVQIEKFEKHYTKDLKKFPPGSQIVWALVPYWL
jgi:hypothetical protein